MNKLQEKNMNYYVVFLCFVIFVNNKCLCIPSVFEDELQNFFPSINISIDKDTGYLFVLRTDTVNGNYFHDVLDMTIENQNVTILKNGTFEYLPKLKSIKILECGLEEIEPGAFGYLPELDILNLNLNHLTTLKSGIFKGLNITTLYLVGNAISTIEKGVLADLLFLEVLDLSRNKISILQPDMFKGTTNLRQLNLNFNKIEAIHYNTFDNVFGNISPGDDSFLDLSDNLLNHIDRKSLKGIYNLGRLDLKNNYLEQLESTIFDEINSLDVFDLENNNLKELKSNILERLTRSSEINLASNPWNCGFAKQYDAWCSRYHKTNTIDYVILQECHIS